MIWPRARTCPSPVRGPGRWRHGAAAPALRPGWRWRVCARLPAQHPDRPVPRGEACCCNKLAPGSGWHCAGRSGKPCDILSASNVITACLLTRQNGRPEGLPRLARMARVSTTTSQHRPPEPSGCSRRPAVRTTISRASWRTTLSSMNCLPLRTPIEWLARGRDGCICSCERETCLDRAEAGGWGQYS